MSLVTNAELAEGTAGGSEQPAPATVITPEPHSGPAAAPHLRHRVAALLRSRAVWMVAMAAVFAASAGGTAYLVSQTLPRVYESNAIVLVGSLTDTSNANLTAYQALAATYGELGGTSPVLTRVIEQLGLSDTVTELGKRVDVRAQAGTAFVRISAQASTPHDAALLADAIGEAIVGLATPLDTGPSLATIVQPGLPPEQPISPRIMLNTALAGGAGAVVGAALVYLVWREAGRPRRRPEDA